MIRHILSSKYGIEVEEETRIGNYEACMNNGKLYTLVPIAQKEQEELTELEQITEHLVSRGDHQVGRFLQSKDGETKVEVEEQAFCVIHHDNVSSFTSKQLGRKLGKFHYRGRTVPFNVEKISRIGQWKGLWEKRLDQIESFWNGMLYKQLESEFDRMFLESFPYYLGLAENAIQYLVDTELDDEPGSVDSGTICHNRFLKETWMGNYYMKNPFDWVFDHCGRDLAEWSRERYFRNIKTYHRDVKKFFADYQTVMPLSSFSWRLVYSRLLFPIHYVECIESYYSSSHEADRLFLEDRMKKYLSQSKDAEQFLRQFFENVEVPVKKMKIPTVDWLAN
ncbi:spore coat putative kinase YutH [Niallia sp. 01092]|uniref:spore coat putative kinase YutH n=1 Tax=unclassified Niallia TaxID=2837522 RepID=UPI003FCF0455